MSNYRFPGEQAELAARGITREHGDENVPRGRSDLGKRISDALAERAATELDGSPESLAEVDRELTILAGALQGVQHRVAELIARVQPAVPREHVAKLLEELDVDRPMAPEEFAIETELGIRLRKISQQLSQVEDALGQTAHAIRL